MEYDLQVTVKAQLPKQRVLVDGKEMQCLGLVEFHACPSRHGLGRLALSVIVQIAAEQNVPLVVGWADAKVQRFYERCGWGVGSNMIVSQVDGIEKHAVFAWTGVAGSMIANVVPVGRDW